MSLTTSLKLAHPAPTPSPGSNSALLFNLSHGSAKGQSTNPLTDVEQVADEVVEDGREEYGVLWQDFDFPELGFSALGWRSGVNLRGENGPPWDGPVVKPAKLKGGKEGEDRNKLAVDESPGAREEADKKKVRPCRFYPPRALIPPPVGFRYALWLLHRPFARYNVFADPKVLPTYLQGTRGQGPTVSKEPWLRSSP